MMPKIDQRQMEQMMRKMGIKQEDIDADEVIIKCSDKVIRISNPSVQRVNMASNVSYQISGDESTEEASSEIEITEEDVKTVMSQTSSTKEEAEQALKDTSGNIAEAILLLTAETEE